MTREEYIALFDSLSEAVEFEGRVLATGDEFLPAVAQRATRLSDQEPPAAYWDFLASQITDEESEETGS